MTTLSAPEVPSTTTTAARPAARGRRRLLLHLVVVALMIIWIVPTLGLLVSSFRPQSVLSTSGWWTIRASCVSRPATAMTSRMPPPARAQG